MKREIKKVKQRENEKTERETETETEIEGGIEIKAAGASSTVSRTQFKKFSKNEIKF